MTVTQAPVAFARSFVLPDNVSPAIADLIDHVRPSVVQIRSAGRGNGTGVIWRPNRGIADRWSHAGSNRRCAQRRSGSGPAGGAGRRSAGRSGGRLGTAARG